MAIVLFSAFPPDTRPLPVRTITHVVDRGNDLFYVELACGHHFFYGTSKPPQIGAEHTCRNCRMVN
jgi:hypothetical protein